ncbi:fatty acid desaturase [Anabaena minutissima FACHB-250]|nr:fatty acid desaturase [Anabaena minutissima FACHB-250]
MAKNNIISKPNVQLIVALSAWFFYLFFIPYIYASLKIFSILFIVFPGVYLLYWLVLFMHECWHNYIPRVNNKIFYLILSWMIFIDPQIFDIVHPYHHHLVNTYDDIEFYPFGEIKNRLLRIVNNFFEIFLGSSFMYVITTLAILRHPKLQKHYRISSLLLAIFMWIIIFGTISYSSHLIFSVTLNQIVITYTLTFWLGFLLVHHNQLIEHGNLIIKGKLTERSLKTRNLKPSSLVEKFLLFMMHQDCLNHTLHHSMSKDYSRPFPEQFPMPETAVYISFKEYLGILKDILTGKTLVN